MHDEPTMVSVEAIGEAWKTLSAPGGIESIQTSVFFARYRTVHCVSTANAASRDLRYENGCARQATLTLVWSNNRGRVVGVIGVGRQRSKDANAEGGTHVQSSVSCDSKTVTETVGVPQADAQQRGLASHLGSVPRASLA